MTLRRLRRLPRGLLVANGLCLVLSMAAVWRIADVLSSPPPEVEAPPRPAPSPIPASLTSGEPATGPSAYAVIASRNLFDPTRQEHGTAANAKPAGPPVQPPVLRGVVVAGEASIAFLEDPATKRVAGYRLGDAVAGGRLDAIAASQVRITRADGVVTVTLRDLRRSRKAATIVEVDRNALLPPTEPTPFAGALPPNAPLPVARPPDH